MEKLYSIPGNSVCCDCGSPEPRWASINFGITLCIECSGIHRLVLFRSQLVHLLDSNVSQGLSSRKLVEASVGH